MIPLYSPYIEKNTLKNVKNCIESNWISSKGLYIKKFERNFSKFIKINHSISVTNGTCAMHLALLGIGISIGAMFVSVFKVVSTTIKRA